MARWFDEWSQKQEVYADDEAREQGSLAMFLATDEDGNIDGDAFYDLESTIPKRRATDDEYLYAALRADVETDEEESNPPGCMLFAALLGGGALMALAELVRWFA